MLRQCKGCSCMKRIKGKKKVCIRCEKRLDEMLKEHKGEKLT